MHSFFRNLSPHRSFSDPRPGASSAPTSSAFNNARSFSLRASLQGFTLVELLVVIAIIGVLAAIALPAYNNYSLKSRFAEVVTATNPTKTAIAACAATGDCVSSGAISLGSSAATAALTTQTGVTAADSTWAAFYAVDYEGYIAAAGYTPAQAAAAANNDIQQEEAINGSTPALAGVMANLSNSASVCVMAVADYNSGEQCPIGYGTLDAANSAMNAATNPYYSTALLSGGGSATADLPCIGGAGCSPATKYAASVSYDTNGVITATATSNAGLNQETFTLTPSYSSGRVDWVASGTCKTRAGAAIC